MKNVHDDVTFNRQLAYRLHEECFGVWKVKAAVGRTVWPALAQVRIKVHTQDPFSMGGIPVFIP